MAQFVHIVHNNIVHFFSSIKKFMVQSAHVTYSNNGLIDFQRIWAFKRPL